MKLLAFYLPQFHEIKENNEWWGEGYTEWVAVKNAKQYSKLHIQPKIPQNNNYYDLNSDGVNTWKWQSELANKAGIYGFCIYHYWFSGKLLLEKPMEILLENKDIDVNFCICWANETWSRNWDGEFDKVLIEQTYGNQDEWKEHFEYLLPFFKDNRYIKIDNKPIIHIYKGENIKELDKMLTFWNQLAIINGFAGIFIIGAKTASTYDNRVELYDAYYYFEPGYTLSKDYGKLSRIKYGINTLLKKSINKKLNKEMIEHIADTKHTWERIEKRKYNDVDCPGSFVSWDNTPRRSNRGTLFIGSSPILFEKHLKKMIEISKKQRYEFVYINAWNEWGEGAYIEPDEINEKSYLRAIKKAVEKV